MKAFSINEVIISGGPIAVPVSSGRERSIIEKKNSSGVWKTNHRFYVDGNLSFKSGDWRFGIKERVQFTHKDVNNVYQNTRSWLHVGSNPTPYTDTYMNRFRGGLGLEWKINKKNSLDFYGLTDYCYDKNIDTNKKGTKLKSLTYDRTLALTAGVAYKFSF